MTEVIFTAILSGTASRYIKPAWLRGSTEIQPIAFDLRDCTPPETYVSFFLTKGEDDDAKFSDAIKIVSARLRNIRSGAIALLDIAVCLQEVNDEDDDIISFRDQKLPHCGLFYHTMDLAKVNEAKTTLCFLARENLREVAASGKQICAVANQLNGADREQL